jgi:hypothetical protein
MDLVVKIMAKLLSVLALATKQIKQGRLSKLLILSPISFCDSMCRREIHKKVAGRERDRDGAPKIGSTDPR